MPDTHENKPLNANETETTSTQVIKTLANCSPVEFLRQTNKIKYAVEYYLELTGAKEILRRGPAFTGEETSAERVEMRKKQSQENMNALLDVVLDTYAEQTAELIGLMCFMSKEEILETNMVTLLTPLLEILQDKQVLAFFQMLLPLGQMNTRD